MLQLIDIRKSYTTADFTQTALDDVSISFRDNEFVAILGPSGSGKTTMLNIIGGLDHYDSGNLVIDGISTEQYKDRDWDTYRNNRIGFVFQSYNLIPHQTVLANVELALTLSGVSRAERRERAKKALEEVGLGDHVNKKPSQLSGGQMQRVAVARALINDPEILLADEPTGALDSTTSVQIMDLLTEIAKDRLVIMVTHNPELAEEYATRIVNLRDGNILDDSDPYEPEPDEEKVSEKPVRRTSMSFFTAIALSFNNLMTKKGRTIMTAFAGSIGIIGIAAILALANGVNNYIKSVEEDTLTIYPLSIESTGIDMTAMMSSMMDVSEDDTKASDDSGDDTEETQLTETKTLSSLFSGIGTNDLASLKTFLDKGGDGLTDYTNLISYSYSIKPLIYSSDTEDGVRQINPNTAFKPLSQGGLTGTAGGYASMMTSGSNTNIFSEMLNNPDMLDAQYDVVAGKWPESYDECVLVLNYENGINDFTLYAMGLRDPEELDEMVAKVANNEDVSVPLDELSFTYDDILDTTFKLVNAADRYQKDEEHNVWVDKSDDEEYMKGVVENGTDMHIVGIVKPNPDAAATSLSPGICYTSDMQAHLIDEAASSQIVKDQIANPEVDVITGRTFEEEKNDTTGGIDLSTLITVDGDAISNAFSFDTSALSVDTSGFTNLSFDPSSVPAVTAPNMDDLTKGIDVDVDPIQVSALMSGLMQGYLAQYQQYLDDTGKTFDAQEFSDGFAGYLTSQQQTIIDTLGTMVDSEAIQAQLSANLQSYMQTVMQTYMGAFMTSIQAQLSSAMNTTFSQLSANMAGAMNIDTDAFANAFQFNMDEKQLQELMSSFLTAEENSYETNLKNLGYADYSKPTMVKIYPKDFEGKEKVIQTLDNYNSRMEDEGNEEQVITYTDIVGTLMSSVTDIVNMVSYVLVAFVAISLVVSSIMIGIITYISVLERKKEIGILRSIGASKGDISRVFNAETLIVGFVAGLIGIGLTALACIPANAIIYAGFGVANVASLPFEAGVVLIFISMILSFIAGLIPSSAASRKDPVEALRSE